jgi:translation elongation factor EF-G
MERLKSLDPPHKGLRNALSQFSLLAGKTQYNNFNSVQKLKELGNEVFHLLRDHTQTEENFILRPLEEKVPGAAAGDSADHKILDALEQALEQKLAAFDGTQTGEEGHEFYLKFTEFHSKYLEHIAEEDRLTEVMMQQYFTDEELIEHQVQIMQQMEFKTLLLWFKFIVPARRGEENKQVLTAFKANVPAEAYEAAKSTILTVVTAEEWNTMKPD